MSKAKKPAIKKPENPRDTQFAGFAEKLAEELVNNNPANGENTDRFIAGWKQIIARRAYDLVEHAIETADYSGIKQWLQGTNIPLYHKVLQSVPDLTTWPEETK